MPSNPMPRSRRASNPWPSSRIDQQAVLLLPHRNVHLPRAGVLLAVVQRFLHDAIDARLVLFRKFFGNLIAETFTHTPLRLETSRACHSSAAINPRSSSIEGLSSSAMLRTTPMESSTSTFDPGGFFRRRFHLASAQSA